MVVVVVITMPMLMIMVVIMVSVIVMVMDIRMMMVNDLLLNLTTRPNHTQDIQKDNNANNG